MSIWKAALLGAMIPAALVLPAAAQQGPFGGAGPVFEEMDLDGDGKLTLEEVQGAPEAQFAAADANDDGTLDRDELIAAAAERVSRRVDLMIERADTDGDGSISAEEIAEMREDRRQRGLERMFSRFDADGDDAVTEAEFEEAIAEFRGRHGGRFGGRGHGRWFDDRG
jgi:Ca2+-binding EF-hand superfamily protein